MERRPTTRALRSMMAVVAMVGLVVSLLAGCASDKGGEAGVEEQPEASDLVFQDAEVTCSDRDGLFGGRYVTFRVVAAVRNDTDQKLEEGDLPTLASSGFSRTQFACDLGAETLEAGGTGTVTYEGMFDVRHETVPVLAFSCKLSYTGLDEAQADLNADLASVVGAYAQVDADEEAKQDAQERAREAAIQAMRDCVGSPATEGLAAAEAADYSPIFKDSHGVDVTERVSDPADDTGARQATITEVDISEGLFGNSVSFALDHTDPEAARERDEEEAKADQDARAKAEAEAGGSAADMSGAEAPISVENNDDFARVLQVTDTEDPLVARFANAYEGRTITFTARVTDVDMSGSDRYDLKLVAAETTGDDATLGPTFIMRGVRTTDIGLDEGTSLKEGVALAVTARIKCLDDGDAAIILTSVDTSIA